MSSPSLSSSRMARLERMIRRNEKALLRAALGEVVDVADGQPVPGNEETRTVARTFVH